MTECYSQRMLNPYHGIVNVVETADADAVSRDGINWELYVHGGFETAEVDGELRRVELPDVKFGSWSASAGLRRAPARLTMDYAALDAAGSYLLAAVKRHADGVPFPLRDRFELWLLDGEDWPLVLLASAVRPEARELPPLPRWRPGQVARGKFQPGQDAAAARLAERVASTAGATPRAQWFRREEDGRGIGLDGFDLEPELEGRWLAANAFPELLLRERWADPEDSSLASAFLDWQAPVLLQLQHLAPATRARLERAARRWARAVAKYHRLYPETVEEEQLAAALVEARLRDAARHPEDAEEEPPLCPDALLLPFGNE